MRQRGLFQLQLFFGSYLFAMLLLLLGGSTTVKRLTGDILCPLSSVLCVIILVRCVLKMPVGKDRKAWIWFTWAIFLYGIGDLAWRMKDLRLWGPAIENGSAFDLFFLAVPVCFFGGIMVYLHKQKVSITVQNILDLIVAVLVAFVLDWAFFLESILRFSNLGFWELNGMLVLPVMGLACSIVLVFFILTVWRVGPIRLNLIYLAATGISFTVCSHIYVVQVVHSTYSSGTYLDLLWALNVMLTATAGYITSSRHITFYLHQRASSFVINQSFFTYLLVVIMVLGFLLSKPQLTILTGGIILALSLIMTRQIFSIVENTRLVRALEKTNDELKANEEKLEQAMRELKEMNEHIDRQAKTDFLTALYNRRHIDVVLNQLHRTAAAGGEPYGVILLDLDYFKMINDQYGHDFGDKVLIEAARILKLVAGARNIAGRYGGEEFIVLLPSASPEAVNAKGEQIRYRVQELIVRYEDNQKVPLTVSIGATVWTPRDTLQDVIQRADSFLYKAKDKGRNQVVADGTPGE